MRRSTLEVPGNGSQGGRVPRAPCTGWPAAVCWSSRAWTHLSPCPSATPGPRPCAPQVSHVFFPYSSLGRAFEPGSKMPC